MALFSSDGYFKHTPVWVKKVMLSVKTILGAIAISTFFNSHETFAFLVLLFGALLDELSKFIKDEPAPDDKP